MDIYSTISSFFLPVSRWYVCTLFERLFLLSSGKGDEWDEIEENANLKMYMLLKKKNNNKLNYKSKTKGK